MHQNLGPEGLRGWVHAPHTPCAHPCPQFRVSDVRRWARRQLGTVVVGIKPPPTPFLAIFDPWGGFMPPFAGVGLSPQSGGFIPPFGHLEGGGVITPLGWFYPPFLVILSPYWPGGGVGPSQCEPGNSVLEDRQTHSALFRLLWFRLFCFALLCCALPAPPPPPPCLGTALCKNRPLVPRSNSRTIFFTSGYWVFHGSGGCRTAI